MIAFVLATALAASTTSGAAYVKPAAGFVVQFASTTNPGDAAHRLQRLRKAHLKEIHVVSAPLARDRHIYRVVSRRFSTYAEARLAALEARRLLSKAAVSFNGGTILAADTAGRPLIR